MRVNLYVWMRVCTRVFNRKCCQYIIHTNGLSLCVCVWPVPWLLLLIVTETIVWHELSASGHKNDDDNNFYFASWRFNAHNSFHFELNDSGRRQALSLDMCILRFTFSPIICYAYIYYASSLWGNWLYSIIFLRIFTQSVPLYALIWIRCQCQIKPKTTIVTSNRLQGCTFGYKISTMSAWLHRVRLPEFVLSLSLSFIQICYSRVQIQREKCRIHCTRYFYHYITTVRSRIFTIIACYLLPLLLLVLLPSSPSPLPPLLLRLLYAHLSQYHNKQTSESMKSTATTRMSDKRIMSWNTYFMCFFSRSLSAPAYLVICLAFSPFLLFYPE